MEPLMPTTNRAVALQFFEHLYAGRLDAALALMAPQAQYRVMGRPDDFPLAGVYSRDQVTDLLGLIGPTVPNGANPTITTTIADGDAVAVIGHVEAVAASGRDYANNFVFVVTLREDLITQVDEYIDTQHANDVLFSN
jgi:ketosteroid isomerase-like protein